MDWKNTIAEIQRHGKLTQKEIAETVGCAQATISDLANGTTKQPSYALGVSLVDLLDRLNKQAA